MEVAILHLQITDYTGEFAWRWRLLDDHGEELATETVELTAAELSSTGLLDLYRRLWLVDTDPAYRAQSEQAILNPIGDFIGARLLGRIAAELLRRAPTIVGLEVPPDAVRLLGLPFELARYEHTSLMLSGVTWWYHPGAAAAAASRENTGDQRRILAVFALPADASALALVHERRQLARTLAPLGDAVHLEILQYGVTRAALGAALRDAGGWDIVHLSGHGRAGQLTLENADGSGDPVGMRHLLELLAPLAGRTQLVMLSACESGVARAARHGITVGGAVARRPAIALENLGYEVAAALGCAVVAMRYPVEDRFSVTFNNALYRSVLADGAVLEHAVHSSLLEALDDAPGTPLSIATPILLAPAPGLRLGPLKGAAITEPHELGRAPAEAEFYIGSGRTMSSIAETLLGAGDISAVALIGMPGIGKTAAMTESTHLHGHRFDEVVWFALRSGDDVSALRRAVGDQSIAEIRGKSILLVVDDAHHGLDDSGNWRSPELGSLIEELSVPGGRARILLASQRPLPLSPNVRHVVVPLLNRSEAGLLHRQLAERNGIENPERATSLAWLVCRGHPKLTIDVGGGTRAEEKREARRLGSLWNVYSPPAPSTARDSPTPAGSHPGSHIERWAEERITTLPTTSSALLSVICGLEMSDRATPVLDLVWSLFVDAGVIDKSAGPDFTDHLGPLFDAGLAQRYKDIFVLVHPAVAQVARGFDRTIDRITATTMSTWWSLHHDGEHADTESEDALAHYAASAVPYLMRSGAWEAASARAEQAIHHDDSPNMAARLLPLVNTIVLAGSDTPWRRASRYVRAVIVGKIDPQVGLDALTGLFDEAKSLGDAHVMVAAASGIANILTESNPQGAHDWLQEAMKHTGEGTLSPLALFNLRLKSAKLVYQSGADTAHSAAVARDLAVELDALAAGDDLSGANLHTLQAEVRHFQERAGRSIELGGDSSSGQPFFGEADPKASQRELLRAQFNALSEALPHGSFGSGVEHLLAALLAEFAQPGDDAERALVLATLAQLRRRDGSTTDAVALLERALRADYAARASSQAAQDHHQLAIASAELGKPKDAALHLCAAAIIRTRVSKGLFLFVQQPPVLLSIWSLKLLVARRPDLLPDSYASLRTQLAELLGNELETLLSDSPRFPLSITTEGFLTVEWGALPDKVDGDSLTDVLALAHANPSPSQLLDVEYIANHWQETISAVGARDRVQEAQRGIDVLRAAGWTELAAALQRVIAGAGAEVLEGLVGIDSEIVRRTLAQSRYRAP
ncbi:MAG: ATPase protein [Nocardia sp.]|nr:ATPase protein [Nocardia sp.]